MRSVYLVINLFVFGVISGSSFGQACTLTEADLLTAPASYTIPAGQVLCINSNFCMGGTSNFPGSCSNTNVSSLTINGTLRITQGVTFKFQGSINGAGLIDVEAGGRVSLFGSISCNNGLTLRAVDGSITSGTSSSTALVSCNDASCEPTFSNGYKPLGVVAAGLGYTASGCTVVTGIPPTGTFPVVLTAFSGRITGNDVTLTWKTSSEQNNEGFDILWSEKGNGQWAIAGKVSSKAPGGNSNSALMYQFTDRVSGSFGTRYYRLQQNDINGVSSLSKIIMVNGTASNSMQTSASKSAVTIRTYTSNPGQVALRITGAAGNIVYSSRESLQAGSNSITIPNRWAKGVYVITLQAGPDLIRERILFP